MKTRTRWYDPGPELPWLLPVPENDRPNRELPPNRIQLNLLETIARQQK